MVLSCFPIGEEIWAQRNIFANCPIKGASLLTRMADMIICERFSNLNHDIEQNDHQTQQTFYWSRLLQSIGHSKNQKIQEIIINYVPSI